MQIILTDFALSLNHFQLYNLKSKNLQFSLNLVQRYDLLLKLLEINGILSINGRLFCLEGWHEREKWRKETRIVNV